MVRLSVCVVLLLSFIIFSQAQNVKMMSDLERIGTADVIIKASIESVSSLQAPDGKILLTVIRVLKGKAADAVPQQKITIGSLNIPASFAKMLTPGKEFLFFLQQTRDGYIANRGIIGIRPVQNEKMIAELIKAYPVQVTLDDPGTFIFGQATPISIHIKNTTDAPIKISVIKFRGFFRIKEMQYPQIDTYVLPDEAGLHSDPYTPTSIEPQQTYTVQLPFQLACPFMGRDPVLQGIDSFKMAMYVQVMIDQHIPRKNASDTYLVNSPLYETSIAFPKQEVNDNEARAEKKP